MEGGSRTYRSRLRACSGLAVPGRDRLTLLKLSRRLTGMREVPGIVGACLDLVGVLRCYGGVGTGDGGIGRRQWQDIANTGNMKEEVTGHRAPRNSSAMLLFFTGLAGLTGNPAAPGRADAAPVSAVLIGTRIRIRPTRTWAAVCRCKRASSPLGFGPIATFVSSVDRRMPRLSPLLNTPSSIPRQIYLQEGVSSHHH
jgi:hypothetical protein